MEEDRVVHVSGKISIDEEKAPVIIVDKMTEFSLDEDKPAVKVDESTIPENETRKPTPAAKPKSDSEKTLWLNVGDLEDADVDELLETLSFYVGETKVIFVKNGKKMLCSQKVSLNRALLAVISSFLPESCIKIV